MSFKPTEDQIKVLNNDVQSAIVSASAGTGKTATVIEYIAKLVTEGKSLDRLLVVTFTNNAANEMKDRLIEKLMQQPPTQQIMEQLDEVLVSDISTIHSFLQKFIKQNIDKLNISQDYHLLDESTSKEIKNRAYKQVFDRLCQKDEFENLFLVAEKEGGLLKDIVFSLEEKLSAQADCMQQLEYYINNQKDIYNSAQQYLNSLLLERIKECQLVVSQTLDVLSSDDKNYAYVLDYKSKILKISENNSFKENVDILSNLSFGKIPTTNTYAPFLKAREAVSSLIKSYKELSQSQQFWAKNELVEDIYKFFKEYIATLEEIKRAEGVLDFNDLEKLSLELLNDQRVLDEIQQQFDYVFVDEYQDTNPVQEKIIKTIAKKCNFMGIGDPKQGIYGFRNATSEIMEKDIRSYPQQSGKVYYLNANFRSNPKILEFVNKVFSKIMKDENTGISYQKTSMLEGRAGYKDNNLPVVQIDVIDDQIEKKEKKYPKVYDIYTDEKEVDQSALVEARVVARRVEEYLLQEIYDAKLEQFRPVNYSDIAILVRGKSALVEEITTQFAKEKLPLITTIDKKISENEEVEVVKNFLKICLDYRDDVALLSFLSSKLGGLSLETLTELRKENRKDEFYAVFRESEFYQGFKEEIESFKISCQALGIREALQKFFVSKNYFDYLLFKPDGINEKRQISKLLDIIEFSGKNYDLPGLIAYLEAGELKAPAGSFGVNAVTLTTIHASKGLEYPIVILAGMGKDFTKKDPRNGASKFMINNEFGLGCLNIDVKNDTKSLSLPLLAIQEKQRRREFSDEIMLLYVAMTRAKNHLHIIGKQNIEGIENVAEQQDVYSLKTYLKLILNAVNENDKAFNEKNKIIINKIKEVRSLEDKGGALLQVEDVSLRDKISDYINFEYKFKRSTQTAYKNSVTSLNTNNFDDASNIGGSKNLDIGNAYHKALEILDFEKTKNVRDILESIAEIENANLVDPEQLLEMIKLIKSVVKDQKVFKEKQFTMRINASDISPELVSEEIMIQGVVDLFSIGEKNILIDYKYTNEKDSHKLISRYKKQLYLYKKAIEKAFKLKLDEIYLLSLKYGEIIKLK